eukprot:TRINITY_DN632_c0_g1_i4.p1 TRINITY_DN632_c0_g1~~TRINITY_DN632_c0_g1_i4.p1  ORF type:complete len:309 (-),score=83.57 TRINITY_DN632_c0_g1_i4:41-967(-)
MNPQKKTDNTVAVTFASQEVVVLTPPPGHTPTLPLEICQQRDACRQQTICKKTHSLHQHLYFFWLAASSAKKDEKPSPVPREQTGAAAAPSTSKQEKSVFSKTSAQQMPVIGAASARPDFEFDCFISYRVFSEAPVARALNDRIKLANFKTWLDGETLFVGDDWRSKFMSIFKSRTIVLLVSFKALEKMKVAHQHFDNLLVEWALALRHREKNPNVQILPLLVGVREGHILTNFGWGQSGSKLDEFSEEKMLIPEQAQQYFSQGQPSPREVLRRIAEIQGVAVDPAITKLQEAAEVIAKAIFEDVDAV